MRVKAKPLTNLNGSVGIEVTANVNCRLVIFRDYEAFVLSIENIVNYAPKSEVRTVKAQTSVGLCAKDPTLLNLVGKHTERKVEKTLTYGSHNRNHIRRPTVWQVEKIG